ncbi:unnamed protein product, partial [Polarella glacialis]
VSTGSAASRAVPDSPKAASPKAASPKHGVLSAPGPWYDACEKTSMANQVGKLDRKYSGMQASAADRWKENSLDNGVPGPGLYPLKPTVGRQMSKTELADAYFRSEQLRIPEDCNSWIIVRSRNAELTCTTFEKDERNRFLKSNGQCKGFSF